MDSISYAGGCPNSTIARAIVHHVNCYIALVCHYLQLYHSISLSVSLFLFFSPSHFHIISWHLVCLVPSLPSLSRPLSISLVSFPLSLPLMPLALLESPHFSPCPSYSSQQCTSIPSFLLPVQLTPMLFIQYPLFCFIHQCGYYNGIVHFQLCSPIQFFMLPHRSLKTPDTLAAFPNLLISSILPSPLIIAPKHFTTSTDSNFLSLTSTQQCPPISDQATGLLENLPCFLHNGVQEYIETPWWGSAPLPSTSKHTECFSPTFTLASKLTYRYMITRS